MSPEDITDLLTAVSTTKALEPERQRALQSLLINLSRPPLQFRPLLSGGYLTGGGCWQPDHEGAAVLHLVVHNPGQWLPLREGVTREAWRMAAKRAAMALAGVDGRLARALAPAPREMAPGVRFRARGGRVEVRLLLPPGRAIAVGVPQPFL